MGRVGGIAALAIVAGCMRSAPVCPQAPVVTREESAAASDERVERSTWITPEIRADAVVINDATQSAQVTFVSGSQVMLVIALSQGANTAISERGAAVGTARINAGLRLDLQIATALQSGTVYLDGTFASSNLPSVHFQGSLITWSAPDPAAKE